MFLRDGLEEVFRYGNLSARTTKKQLVAAFIVLIPLAVIVFVLGSALSYGGSLEGIIAASILHSTFLILSLPLLVAIVVRRINDQFPGSGWASFFSIYVPSPIAHVFKFAGLWAGFVILAIAIGWLFWPTYFLIVVAVLVLPTRQNSPVSLGSYPPPPLPPQMSRSLSPLPVATQPAILQAGIGNEGEVTIYRQGIFWFAVSAAILLGFWTANPGIFNLWGQTDSDTVPTNTPPGVEETIPTNSPTSLSTATPVITPTASVFSTLGPENEVVDQSVVTGLDPRFQTCADANASGYGPYVSGIDPEYDWYIDRDKDGINCER